MGDAPPAPQWFKVMVTHLSMMYPASKFSERIIPSWWIELGVYDRDAIKLAFRRAMRDSPERMPSCPKLVDYAKAAQKSLKAKNEETRADRLLEASEPRPDYTLSPSNPFNNILNRFRNGDIPKNEQESAETVKSIIEALTKGFK